MKYQSDIFRVDGVVMHLPPVKTACGNTASFDDGSGYGYRCDACGAVIGSIGMPRRCKDLYDMEEVVNKLKGKKDVNI
jgi:hypothetical protein